MTKYETIVRERMAALGSRNPRPGSTDKCLQFASEMAWLAPFVDELQPKVIVEIGIYKAGWPYVLAPWFAPGAHIIGIDSMQRHKQDDGGVELDETIEELEADGFKVDIIVGRSDDQETEYAAKALCPKPIWGSVDLLHIDGDHTYAGASHDCRYYSPLVRRKGGLGRPGGLTVLHDIGTATSQMNVKKLWEEIKDTYPGRTHEFIEGPGIGIVEM